jgi:hypothetical protein
MRYREIDLDQGEEPPNRPRQRYGRLVSRIDRLNLLEPDLRPAQARETPSWVEMVSLAGMPGSLCRLLFLDQLKLIVAVATYMGSAEPAWASEMMQPGAFVQTIMS